MRIIGDSYRNLLSQHISPKHPTIPFYSSMRGGAVLSKASEFGPLYWQQNLENPVLFHTAVKAMLESSSTPTVALEVGPHSTLRGPLRQIFQETNTSLQYIPTLTRGDNDTEAFLSALGQLYTSGVHVELPLSHVERVHVLSDLPTYPWNYEKSYWAETRVMKNWRFRKHSPHDLLGSRTVDGTDLVPTWRNEIQVRDLSWLREHCVGNDIIFPAAAYVAMAGEAVYQLEDSPTATHAYTVRQLELRQAMVLHEGHPTELITILRPQRLTSSLDGDWYEFQVMSYDEAAGWNKHCSGLVRSGRVRGPSPKMPMPEALPRKVSSARWYKTMAGVGLNYGPRFTGLQNITAGVTERSAVAEITDRVGDGSESYYPLHPATLDSVLQLWMVSAFQGDYRLFKNSFVPTYIEEIYVGVGTGKSVRIKTITAGRNVAAGRHHAEGQSYGVGIEDGELVYSLKGFRGTKLQSDDDPPELTALQLQWKPDFSFLDAGKLTRGTYNFREQLYLAEKLYILCAVESYRVTESITATQPHYKHYKSWLETQVPRFEQPGYPLVSESSDLVKMSVEDRRALIPQVLEQCKVAGCGAIATAVWRTYDQLVNVMEGKTDFLDLLLHDGALAAIYDWMNDIWDVSDFFQLLGHTQPQMRILEIGAGTGGLTAKILKHLQSEFGERLYLTYTYTDVSSGFFVAARERFQQYDGIEYRVLDISKDPIEQGFNPGDYDLVIASNVSFLRFA